MFAPLPRSFYEPSAKLVARKLLGHWLIRQTPDGPCGGPIVETEAYLRDDPACHAAAGLTNRTRVMFGQPGRAYVYLIYGFYYCFNAVCLPEGEAEAVLVRAVQPEMGVEWMMKNRPVDQPKNLTNGPGKLCAAMNLDRALDGADLCSANSAVFIAENPAVRAFRRKNAPMIRTTRIGLTRGIEMPLRFYLARSAWVSKQG